MLVSEAKKGTVSCRIEALRPCPVCGHRGAADLIHQQRLVPFEDSHFPNLFNVVACGACGMVYSDVDLPQQSFDHLYTHQSKYVQPPRPDSMEERRQEQTAKTLLAFLRRKDARILDVGCATGSLLKELEKLGCTDLNGMDPSGKCLEQVHDIVDAATFIGTLADLPFHPDLDKFDLVILSHVLEHVADVPAALGAVAALLAPDGVAYVEVPDAARYAEFCTVPFQDFNTEHVNHWSMKYLVGAARYAGLQLDEWGRKTFPHPEPHVYPAVYGFFRRASNRFLVREDIADLIQPTLVQENPEGPDVGHLAGQVRLYAERSAQMWAAMEKRLADELGALLVGQFAGGHRRLQPVIWGTGELTYKLLAGALGQVWFGGFVDSNPIYWGRKLAGKAVMRPEELVHYLAARPVLPVPVPIVAAGILHGDSIVRAVRELGLSNPVIPLKAG